MSGVSVRYMQNKEGRSKLQAGDGEELSAKSLICVFETELFHLQCVN